MDHDDALEALQLAAAEPGGLDRLMAGDTPQAAAMVGHLAGCDACSTELERLRRGVPVVRDVVRTSPPADLRQRTLAFVREHGIPRPVAAAPDLVTTAAVAAQPMSIPVAGSGDGPAAPGGTAGTVRAGRPSILPWVASIAAAVVLSVVASTLIIGARVDAQLAAQDRATAGLEAVTSATLTITAEPDAERVALASTDGSETTGSLLFSPSTTELVVVADGLAQPPAGQEYRCWLLLDGARRDVGRMFFADELAFWAGDTPEVATVGEGTTFGVSLTQVDTPSLDADPVIVGEL
jgi:Anti-sigma-K factor rskA